MHLTYATPGTAEYYRQNRKFPDGAVLVKEINGTDHAQMTTGDAHWATGIKQWFVLIKDEKHAFQITHCGAMDGDGHSSKPMCPITRSQPTTKKTASTATFRPSLPTGYTSKAIRSSNRNENPPFPVKRHITEETIPMKQTWRGHSAFRIEAGEAKISIDPFLSVQGQRMERLLYTQELGTGR